MNVARALGNAVKLARAGKFENPAKGLQTPIRSSCVGWAEAQSAVPNIYLLVIRNDGFASLYPSYTPTATAHFP